MPVLFVGHGSPMNAIEENEFTRGWTEIATKLPKPEAILSVSAHWTMHGIKVTDSPKPRQIYDMYGFPRELYEVAYEPAGSPELAHFDPLLYVLGASEAMDRVSVFNDACTMGSISMTSYLFE